MEIFNARFKILIPYQLMAVRTLYCLLFFKMSVIDLEFLISFNLKFTVAFQFDSSSGNVVSLYFNTSSIESISLSDTVNN